jgi:N6-adenosine-specific RNA methylase IME4
LKDLGITKWRSSRAQKLAELPQEAFDGYVSDKIMLGDQPTIAGALKLQKQTQAAQRAIPSEEMRSGFVTSLQTLLDEGRKFSTIVADPPWRHDNQASRAAASNHYPTMSLEEICKEPVADLATKNCHLHLWATSPLLPEALAVMEAWGFQYKSSFVWVKRQIGMGNYWRVSHELLLLGLRGKLGFRDHAQRSWLEADRTEHSAKPEEVRTLIEKVSPRPYLELYGRTSPPDSEWTVYGNELVRGAEV